MFSFQSNFDPIDNAMSGGLHAKQYYQEDGLCATVIRHLRVFGPLKDNGS